MPSSFTVGSTPLAVYASRAQPVVMTVSGATVYYKSLPNVTVSSYDGSVASGSSVTFTQVEWIVCGTGASVSVTEQPAAMQSSAGSSGSVSVGVSSTQVVAANGSRLELVVFNDHASNTVYLGLGTAAVANRGIRLNPLGGSYKTSTFTGAVYAIATGASTTVTYAEV